MANLIEQLDAQISTVLSDWSLSTTILATLLVLFIAYPIFTYSDPDTHPLLLARQATLSPVRQPHESAIYRSLETPHGWPLKTGLNVKDPGAPKWTSGRDGDLRDIWREVCQGGNRKEDGVEVPKGVLMTVLGTETIEHDVQQVSKEINIIGAELRQRGGSTIAIYLPNSMELLSTLFACAFYGLDVVLLPYNLPHNTIFELLQRTEATALVAPAGSVPLSGLVQHVASIRQVIWTVEKTSRHMDWRGAPPGFEDNVRIRVWHDLVQSAVNTPAELPTNDQATPGTVTMPLHFSAHKADTAIKPFKPFTQGNLVSAVAALMTSLPPRQRLNSSDLVLPADSLTNSYVLCYTLAALISHSSVAINSVAGPGVDLALASRSISPTVIIASAATMANIHRTEMAKTTSLLSKI
ncbi:hypothetical protein LTR66_015685, partial [Elasticomyces elasticus]